MYQCMYCKVVVYYSNHVYRQRVKTQMLASSLFSPVHMMRRFHNFALAVVLRSSNSLLHWLCTCVNDNKLASSLLLVLDYLSK